MSRTQRGISRHLIKFSESNYNRLRDVPPKRFIHSARWYMQMESLNVKLIFKLFLISLGEPAFNHHSFLYQKVNTTQL